jgi:hypothetical protein
MIGSLTSQKLSPVETHESPALHRQVLSAMMTAAAPSFWAFLTFFDEGAVASVDHQNEGSRP